MIYDIGATIFIFTVWLSEIFKRLKNGRSSKCCPASGRHTLYLHRWKVGVLQHKFYNRETIAALKYSKYFL